LGGNIVNKLFDRLYIAIKNRDYSTATEILSDVDEDFIKKMDKEDAEKVLKAIDVLQKIVKEEQEDILKKIALKGEIKKFR